MGGVEERSIDVRVVATCTRMDDLMPAFRSRLEGAILRLPSLKEQITEIPHKVEEMIAGRRAITPDALAELARHPWEGNLVELRSTVDRLVALANGAIGRKLVRSVFATTKSCRVASRVHAPRVSHLESSLAH